jgi:hypothetical protein
MNFEEWLEEVDEMALTRFGQPISASLLPNTWLMYFRDGLTPEDVCKSLNDS